MKKSQEKYSKLPKRYGFLWRCHRHFITEAFYIMATLETLLRDYLAKKHAILFLQVSQQEPLIRSL